MIGVDVQELRVIYRRKGEADLVALDAFTLRAHDEMVALLGPNGSGKSTLMGVISQSIKPESGRLVSPTTRRGLSVVFQTPALDTLLSVRENLRLAGALHGMGTVQISERIETVCEELEIHDRLDEQVRRLSGGLARRADLARALLPSPAVLLLDEPTSGLDIDARKSFWDAMLRVRAHFRMTVLLATHLIDEAERADRVLMMREGQMVCLDTPDALRGALGTRVLRVGVPDPIDLLLLRGWIEQAGFACYTLEQTLLVPDADASLLGTCPLGHATLTLSPPSLEDVYSIKTRRGVLA